jgi:hypothetical protein
MPTSRKAWPSDDDDNDDVGYLDLGELARYSGLSISSLRRFLRDPDNPLPHHRVRGAGKARGRLLVRKAEFDAWVRAFAPAAPDAPATKPGPDPVPDVRWIRRGFGK